MQSLLFFVYVINAVLLINHEIDSAYWQEWKLFHLPGGESGFLLIHFPLLFVVLYGLLKVRQADPVGLLFSFLLAGGGFFAFFIHRYFIRKGNPEFKTAMSQFILNGTLLVSAAQMLLTAGVLFTQWNAIF